MIFKFSRCTKTCASGAPRLAIGVDDYARATSTILKLERVSVQFLLESSPDIRVISVGRSGQAGLSIAVCHVAP